SLFLSPLLQFLFLCLVPHRDLHSFPTRRSSDLALQPAREDLRRRHRQGRGEDARRALAARDRARQPGDPPARGDGELPRRALQPDRKSTRLNSSHSQISYAVFCLKKKKKKKKTT